MSAINSNFFHTSTMHMIGKDLACYQNNYIIISFKAISQIKIQVELHVPEVQNLPYTFTDVCIRSIDIFFCKLLSIWSHVCRQAITNKTYNIIGIIN